MFDHQTGKEWELRAASVQIVTFMVMVFSHDGQYLYATEGESTLASRGVIGVYEVKQGLPKVAELPILQ
ncbi:DUF1513 domain-containing protein [Photobacterium leiognathi]|uniref:DUF1513 domain-containing protein n=1 Tax=Photobacterium leiognathi TaxID=553611 RepID=UPI0027343F5B|nr:DUF1513 domain-containing protein [Photobacterium leiognathi]